MRLGKSFLATIALTLAIAAPSAASPILVGTSVTFDLLDTGFGNFTDTKTIASAGTGISAGDGSDIGDNAMITGEFIKVFNTSLQFSLFGGGPDAATPGYKTTGYGPDARYVLSNLYDASTEIAAVSLALSNVTGVTLGSEVLFDAHSVTLYIDDLGILVSSSNLGLVTLNITTRDVNGSGPTPVPEPTTLTLLGSGVVAAWVRRRRASNLGSRLS